MKYIPKGALVETKHKCFYCGVKLWMGWSGPKGIPHPSNMATRDHIIPKSFGGNGLFNNKIWACYQCNTERAHTPFYEFLQKKIEEMDSTSRAK